MSAIPVFEIGVWNAWIFAIVLLLYAFTPYLIKNFTKKMGQSEEMRKSSTFMTILFFILMVCSIFLPLKLGMAWFYTGLLIYLLGLVICTIAIVNVASTPLGKVFEKGAYRYSRNPGDLGMIIVFLGIGIASASWFWLLLSAILILLTCFNVAAEERFLIGQYGDAYRDYMNRTPRWIGIPKIVKSK